MISLGEWAEGDHVKRSKMVTPHCALVTILTAMAPHHSMVRDPATIQRRQDRVISVLLPTRLRDMP